MIFYIIAGYLLLGIVVAVGFFGRDFVRDERTREYFDTWAKQAGYVLVTILMWPYALYCRVKPYKEES